MDLMASLAAFLSDIQLNLAISNSVNSKSPLFRRKIECPWIYPFPLRFPGYYEAPLFRTFFHFPWDFELLFGTVLSIVNYQMCIEKARNDLSGIEK